MNPLNHYPQVRRVAYVVQFFIGLALGGVQVGYSAAETGQPTWLTVALAVFAFLVAGTGLTAAQNVPSYVDVVEGDASPPSRDELGRTDLFYVLMILLVIVVVAVLLL